MRTEELHHLLALNATRELTTEDWKRLEELEKEDSETVVDAFFDSEEALLILATRELLGGALPDTRKTPSALPAKGILPTRTSARWSFPGVLALAAVIVIALALPFLESRGRDVSSRNVRTTPPTAAPAQRFEPSPEAVAGNQPRATPRAKGPARDTQASKTTGRSPALVKVPVDDEEETAGPIATAEPAQPPPGLIAGFHERREGAPDIPLSSPGSVAPPPAVFVPPAPAAFVPPAPAAVAQPERQSVYPPFELRFSSGSSDPLKLDQAQVDRLVETVRWLKENSWARVELRGLPDSTGTAEERIDLADKRTLAVRGFLEAKEVDRSQIITIILRERPLDLSPPEGGTAAPLGGVRMTLFEHVDGETPPKSP